MKNLKSKIACIYLRSLHGILLADQKEVTNLQNTNYKKLRKSLDGTKVSRKFGLDNLESYKEYAEHFKVREYDDFKPFIDAHVHGATNVLFKKDVLYFGLTSGTSGKDSKKVPYNKEMISSFQKAQKYLAAVISHEVKGLDLLTASRLSYGSSPITYEEDGMSFGYISGILTAKTPASLKKMTHPSIDTLSIENWEHKMNEIYEQTINVDLKVASGIPTYLISIFEYVLERTGKKTISEIWPNLETVIYGATTIDQYRDRLNELVGKRLNYFGIYASTEAPIGIGINNAKDEKQVYTFHPELVFTFNEVETLDQCGIGELEIGVDYFVNTSTPNGLINYAMKDIIRIKSVSPVLTFEVLGRQGSGINLAAEKTTDEHVLDSVVALSKKIGTNVDHYFLSPSIKNGKHCYSWTIFSDELNNGASSTELESLIDQILCENNLDYADCREDSIIESPVVTIAPSNFIKEYFDLYKNKGQFKMKTVFGSSDDFQSFLNNSIPNLQSYLGSVACQL
ncbi:GH3 auxin-responsive promoter family protein [Halobacteriovorax sp. HLS]|uniref:GH3 family domain-containing protein n=1 Tax=Halobacteriovorax sp. HLS TaxID=2234000 RepID=UPI0013E3A602|nr:GH3 auxin-responsive promoter family protein [Halobacteriovorax sp. HLS]